MGYLVKSRLLQSGSSGVVLPSGPTSERPIDPSTGLIRYNLSTSAIEFYDGSSYQILGTANSITYLVDNFVGNGVSTEFMMTQPVAAADKILVFMGSIYQTPGVYSVDGTKKITFVEPPPIGLPFNVIHSYV
jgi:hypothetical protein